MGFKSFVISGSDGDRFRNYDIVRSGQHTVIPNDCRGKIDENFVKSVRYDLPNDRIKLVGPTSVDLFKFTVDRYVEVVAKSEEIYKQNTIFWAAQLKYSIISGLTSLVASGGAITAFSIAEGALILGAAAVSSVAFPILTCLLFYRAHQAQSQMNAWSLHPSRQVANQRREAYTQGFFFVMGKDLKGKVLHLAEVQEIYVGSWMAAIKSFGEGIDSSKQSSNQAKSAVVQSFFRNNPLSLKAFKYADSQPYFRPFTDRYEGLHAAYSTIQKFFNEKRQELETSYNKRSNELDLKRNSLLQPFKRPYEAAQQQVLTQFNSKKGNFSTESKEMGMLVQGRDFALRNLDLQFKQKTSGISQWLTRQINTLNLWKAAQLKKIEQSKDSALSSFYFTSISDLVEDCAMFMAARDSLPEPSAPPDLDSYNPPVELDRPRLEKPPGGPEINNPQFEILVPLAPLIEDAI